MRKMPYKQGIFNPLNQFKYKGSTPIIFRSQLELFFYRWCDRNDRVLQWGSESVVIPYLSPKDGKMHKYFVDAIVLLKTDNGNKKFLIEIKPEKQTKPPSTINRKSKKNLLYEQITWAVNSSKWNYAREWCEKNGCEFIILTEKDLK